MRITSAVLRLLNKLNPYALEPGSDQGVPVDEYRPEALPMANPLINRGEISAAHVNGIWQAWFDEPLGAGADERFVRFIEDLNALVTPSP